MLQAGKPGIPDRTETLNRYSRLIHHIFCKFLKDPYLEVSCTWHNVFYNLLDNFSGAKSYILKWPKF